MASLKNDRPTLRTAPNPGPSLHLKAARRRRLAETLERHATSPLLESATSAPPRWAADLVAAVFQANVAVSRVQMEAYAALLRAVADGLDEFLDSNRDGESDDGD